MARQIQIGDRFQGTRVGRIVEVRWIDPENPSHIAISDMKRERDDETVSADDLLKSYTLIEEE
jgi:hypothetical protein